MKAEFNRVSFLNNEEVKGPQRIVHLPFDRVSARAIIIRRCDGKVLGTLHRQGAHFAFPGGAVEDGESTLQATKRELVEENIVLANAEWLPQFAVDYFDGYKELSVWHLALVDDAAIGSCPENIESRWLDQLEDVWHPYMREKMIVALNLYCPELARANVVVRAR
jgi:8-oxo-dGTP pyrophosphatase MutT (NUDIX family)